MRGRAADIFVTRAEGADTQKQPDSVIVEEPMEIRLDGRLVTTTMRTPGNDFELAVGFCHSEGLLADAGVEGCRYCAEGSAVETEFNVVTVDTGGRARPPTPRLTTTTSSCGICGSQSITELTDRLEPIRPTVDWSAALLCEAADSAGVSQPLFDQTGGVHAAAAFDSAGRIEIVREDVGRHNAVDKVVGRLLLDDRLPAGPMGLYVSGRASFDLVQKAWAAGFEAMVSVSAPSSLAVETARAAGLVLAGFVREGGCNLYAPAP